MKQKILIEELKRLLIYYPQHKRSINEIAVLSEMWFEDLKDIPDDDFHQAIIKYRINNKYFPIPKDIRECYRQICRNQIKDTKMLPFPDFTPEKMEENKKKIRALRLLKKV